ncbi:MAG: kinase/pyrophosphorylase [Alphaproteobacteria bacterium]|nr:kinase/pyrophosphorylase [Alphaproteobacteria bacterium]
MKKFHLHLVSDSTGETVCSVSRAALAQFEDIDADEHVWSLVRTKAQMERVITGIHNQQGMVLYTIVNKQLRDQLKAECLRLNVPCIPAIARIITEMATHLEIETSNLPGRQHELNDEYFSRVEAINYALAHDDGQAHWELDESDIVLVGPSRTSKSPTCIYLAYRGYKAANIPYVKGCPLPEELETLKKPLVVGLTIDVERLLQIRRTRLHSLKQEEHTNYIDMDEVKKEIAESRRYYMQHRWPIIDVTRRSVEETSAQIIQLHHKRLEQLLDGAT